MTLNEINISTALELYKMNKKSPKEYREFLSFVSGQYSNDVEEMIKEMAAKGLVKHYE